MFFSQQIRWYGGQISLTQKKAAPAEQSSTTMGSTGPGRVGEIDVRHIFVGGDTPASAFHALSGSF